MKPTWTPSYRRVKLSGCIIHLSNREGADKMGAAFLFDADPLTVIRSNEMKTSASSDLPNARRPQMDTHNPNKHSEIVLCVVEWQETDESLL